MLSDRHRLHGDTFSYSALGAAMLIQCQDCQAVHESTLTAACPVCGRCPACGRRRVSRQQLADESTCRSCGVPYCAGCGRCHICGKVRLFEVGVCPCGYPDSSEQIVLVERYFGLR
jgi:hypothetical protein